VVGRHCAKPSVLKTFRPLSYNARRLGPPSKKELFSRLANSNLISLLFTQLLKKVDVNIYDLIDAARSGVAARTFTDDRQLAKYTKENGKVFPKAHAKQNKLLKFMLRRIIN
jgi:hypothetical protein